MRLIFLIAQQVSVADLDARPRFDDRLDLTALECKLRRGRPLEAGDDLELRSDQFVHQPRKHHRRRGRAGAGDDHFAALGVLDALEAGCRPRVLDLDIRVDAADPGVFAGVVVRCRAWSRAPARPRPSATPRPSRCRPWLRRCRDSWRRAGRRRPACSARSHSDCRADAHRYGGRRAGCRSRRARPPRSSK